MTDVRDAAQNLIEYAIHRSMIGQDDRIWAYNTILECIGATGPALDMTWALQTEKLSLLHPDILPDFDLEGTLAVLSEAAVANGAAEDTTSGRDRIAMRVMGVLMPRPSVVNEEFNGRLGVNEPKAATDWFYGLCCDAGYVRRAAIARNIKWSTPTNWGDLEITINLSKPEKDPRAIAAAKLAPQSGYPKCALCAENEGYAGRMNHPARQNHRIIPLELDSGSWYLQYSPYVYYNEHCIVLNAEHTPMRISAATFRRLLDFTKLFPHYFLGSNADLPIVGGSILSHDHFQGGHYTFAMEKAPVETPVSFAGFPDIAAGIVKWPMSVLRLTGSDPDRLCLLAEKILTAWRGYTDEAAMVFAETDGTPHNTITPIARRRGEDFELDLVLRNNLTTPEHPLGLYHPHEQLHHIKKENIGLIEVMGLAVLPARLDKELALLKDAILSGRDLRADETLQKHADWAEALQGRYTFTPENTEQILQQEVGAVFMQVLEDAGVYKRTPAGQSAFLRFTASV